MSCKKLEIYSNRLRMNIQLKDNSTLLPFNNIRRNYQIKKINLWS